MRVDLIKRVTGEPVVEQSMFGEMYAKQIRDPRPFWAPYSLAFAALCGIRPFLQFSRGYEV